MTEGPAPHGAEAGRGGSEVDGGGGSEGARRSGDVEEVPHGGTILWMVSKVYRRSLNCILYLTGSQGGCCRWG